MKNSRIVVFGLLAALDFAFGGSAWGQVPAEGKRYAVCVGVEDYAHPKLREPAPLKYAVEDAAALAKVLTAGGFEVVLLTDEAGKKDPKLAPTKANIEAALANLGRDCKAEDALVLALSGHGVQFPGQKDAYFCPQDARPAADETDTLLSLSKVYAEFRKRPAGVRLILIDACRTDPEPGGPRGLDADSAPRPPRGVAALFSCGADQRAFEHASLGRGVFFHHVLEGLEGAASNRRGETTINALAEHAAAAVPATMRKLFPGREQQPRIKPDQIGRSPVVVRTSLDRPAAPVAEGLRVGEVRSEEESGMKFVWCPAGKFQMGSPATDADAYDCEKPQVEVELSRGFWLGKYEVTKDEWKEVMKTEPWKGWKYVQEGAEYPATHVSWNDAASFCKQLTERGVASGSLAKGWSYRLPSEAEWEYGCRAGRTTRYSFDDDADLGDYAWYRKNTHEVAERYAHAVGRKKPNDWGFHDMHGNLWEWCGDWWGEKLPGGRDPVGVASGSYRVLRGGGWQFDAEFCRSAHRHWSAQTFRYFNMGFRVARVRESP